MILPSCLQQSKQQSSHELLQPYHTYHTYHTLQAAVAMRSGVRLWDIIVQAKVPSWQVAWIQLMRVDLIIVHEHFCFLRSSISWYHDMIYFDMIWHLTSINYINCQLTSFYTIYILIFLIPIHHHSPMFKFFCQVLGQDLYGGNALVFQTPSGGKVACGCLEQTGCRLDGNFGWKLWMVCMTSPCTRFTPDDETFFNTTLSVLREARIASQVNDSPWLNMVEPISWTSKEIG